LPGTTVRIREDTHETLQDLRRQTGEPMPDIVARAVDQFYRRRLIAETNCGYAALRESGEAIDELEVLEGSLADGLD
jgi:predicted transcriptional regulator